MKMLKRDQSRVVITFGHVGNGDVTADIELWLVSQEDDELCLDVNTIATTVATKLGQEYHKWLLGNE